MFGLRLVSPIILAAVLSACAAHTSPVPSKPAQPETAPAISDAAPPEDLSGISTQDLTTTTVAERIAGFNDDLKRLSDHLDQDHHGTDDLKSERAQYTSDYAATIAAINRRLQAGTTPGNPEVMAMWYFASKTLDGLELNLTKLSDVSDSISVDSGVAQYLASTINDAFALQGGVDSDHQTLVAYEAQAGTDASALGQLGGATTQDVTQETEFLAVERRNLPTLLHSIEIGAELGPNLANYPTAADQTPPSSAEIAAIGGMHKIRLPRTHPRLIISTDEFPTDYEPDLYSATVSAINRSPSAKVSIIIVLPGAGSPKHKTAVAQETRRLATSIDQALASFGLQSGRIVTSWAVHPGMRTGEVWIYTH